MTLACALGKKCSGCDKLHLTRHELESERKETLRSLGLEPTSIDFVWIQNGGLRDRLEFSLTSQADGPRFGLYDKDRKEIVDIAHCPQLSPALQSWLETFRLDLPHIPEKRSVRLRVSPSGVRGVWLDFANEDIRDILDEANWLERQIQKNVIVEVGQKRKRVVKSNDGPRAHRLDDATLEAWFETPLNKSDLESAQLFGTIGTFTQPGFSAQRALVHTMLSHLEHRSKNLNHIAEFGSGIGSFTLPLLATGAAVSAFESDRLATLALEKAVETAKLDRSKLHVHSGDFILSTKAADRAFASVPDGSFDLVVVDPPRPGVGRFIDSISMRAPQADWIYVSCYPESFAQDTKELQTRGLTLGRVSIVEQFPFTRHFEIVATLLRN